MPNVVKFPTDNVIQWDEISNRDFT